MRLAKLRPQDLNSLPTVSLKVHKQLSAQERSVQISALTQNNSNEGENVQPTVVREFKMQMDLSVRVYESEENRSCVHVCVAVVGRRMHTCL